MTEKEQVMPPAPAIKPLSHNRNPAYSKVIVTETTVPFAINVNSIEDSKIIYEIPLAYHQLWVTPYKLRELSDAIETFPLSMDAEISDIHVRTQLKMSSEANNMPLVLDGVPLAIFLPGDDPHWQSTIHPFAKAENFTTWANLSKHFDSQHQSKDFELPSCQIEGDSFSADATGDIYNQLINDIDPRFERLTCTSGTVWHSRSWKSNSSLPRDTHTWFSPVKRTKSTYITNASNSSIEGIVGPEPPKSNISTYRNLQLVPFCNYRGKVTLPSVFGERHLLDVINTHDAASANSTFLHRSHFEFKNSAAVIGSDNCGQAIGWKAFSFPWLDETNVDQDVVSYPDSVKHQRNHNYRDVKFTRDVAKMDMTRSSFSVGTATPFNYDPTVPRVCSNSQEFYDDDWIEPIFLKPTSLPSPTSTDFQPYTIFGRIKVKYAIKGIYRRPTDYLPSIVDASGKDKKLRMSTYWKNYTSDVWRRRTFTQNITDSGFPKVSKPIHINKSHTRSKFIPYFTDVPLPQTVQLNSDGILLNIFDSYGEQ